MKKNFLFVVFIMLSISFSTLSAADNMSQNNLILKPGNQLILSINLGDISDLSASDIAKKIDSSIENMYPEQKKVESLAELECTVSVTVTAGVGSNTIAVTATVTGPCSQVRAQAVKMAQQLVAAIKTLL